MNRFDPCPCHYCVAPKRHPGCHDTCTKEYIPWKAREEARKAAEAGKSAIDAYSAESVSRSRTKEARYKMTRRTYFKGHK